MRTTILTSTSSNLNSLAALLLRCTAGVILFVVGSGKVFGWFGGYGLSATIHAFTTMMGIPAPLAYLSTFTELIGGILFVLGLLTRPAALAVAINMAVATAMTMPKGFFMPSGGAPPAAYPFTLFMISLAVLAMGPMSLSLDAVMGGSREKAVVGKPVS